MAKYTFTGQKAKEFEPLAPGDYKFIITDYEFSTADSGSEMCSLTMETEDGKKFFDRLVFHEKAMWKIDIFLTSIGKAPKVGLTFDFDAKFAESIVGCAGVATLGIREYQGKKYNEVKVYRDPAELIAKGETATEKASEVVKDGIPF